MDNLRLEQVSKRFQTNWIFRKLSVELSTGESLFVNGPNGSGKSTLLKVISGWVSPNEGTVVYRGASGEISVDDVFNYVSICAPYLELLEEFTLEELLNFHQGFKPLSEHNKANEFAGAIEIEFFSDKPIITKLRLE